MKTDCVIVVGNGASLLDAAHGAFIDGPDIVVRFNLFTIEGYTKHVGTKTTYSFSNRGTDSKQGEMRLRRHAFERFYAHTWGDNAAAVQSFVSRLPEERKSTQIAAMDESAIRQKADYLGKHYRVFSTGAIGVWVLLHAYRFVTLVAFDWSNGPTKFHYSDSSTFNHHDQHGHQPLLERAFLENLQREQRLTLHA